MSRVPVRCSCKAFFFFAETPAGERMPMDPAPRPDGNREVINRGGDLLPLSRHVPIGQRPGRRDLYVSHFATCPHEAQYRLPRKAGPVGMWLAANSPVDLPYPCRCHSEHVGCRAGGRHCPCWGRTDLDHLPAACCAKLAARQSTKETTFR